MPLVIHKYIFDMCPLLFIYIYIYIERERERERGMRNYLPILKLEIALRYLCTNNVSIVFYMLYVRSV